MQRLIRLAAVGHPLCASLLQRFAGVVDGALDEHAFLAPRRRHHTDGAGPPAVWPLTATLREPLRDQVHVVDLDRQQDARRDEWRRLVELLDEAAQDLGVRLVHRTVQLEDVPADDQALAHEKHLDVGLLLLARQSEDVHVRAVAHLHHLTLRGAVDRLDLVPQAGGTLVLEAGGGLLHFAAKVARDLVRATLKEHDRLLDDSVVFLLRAEGGAGADAAVDEVLQAGPRVVAGDLFRARAPGEELLHEVQRSSHRAGRSEGPEVARTVVADAARDLDARPLLGDVDLEVGVVLIVLEAHVVERLVPLDQRGLEQQGLLRRAGEDELDVRDLGDEAARLRLEGVRRAEV